MYHQVFKLHSKLLKALSHSKRLEIVHLLRDQQLSVGQIQTMLDLPQANLSQHLMVLREVQVVGFKRQGKEIYYKLAHKNFIKASDLLREVLIDRYKHDVLADEFTQKMKDLVPLETDPVCHMRVSPKTAAAVLKLKDKTYYFCASGCKKTFKANPKKFIKE